MVEISDMEVEAMWRRVRAGDEEAVADLLAALEPLVRRLAFRLAGRHARREDVEEIAQAARLGLLKALRTTRSDVAVFGPFGYLHARGAALRARRARPVVRPPRRVAGELAVLRVEPLPEADALGPRFTDYATPLGYLLAGESVAAFAAARRQAGRSRARSGRMIKAERATAPTVDAPLTQRVMKARDGLREGYRTDPVGGSASSRASTCPSREEAR